jgi:hypothetical protein
MATNSGCLVSLDALANCLSGYQLSRDSRTVRNGPSYLNCPFRKGLAATADLGIDQLSAFLVRRGIELNCSTSLLALLKPGLNCNRKVSTATESDQFWQLNFDQFRG